MVRAKLSRETVLRAAVAIADRSGLSALSMRRLANDLGVEAMSLYNHVKDKRDLHTGMISLVWAKVDLAKDELEWRRGLRRLCGSAQHAILEHPWFFELSLPANGGPTRLAVVEATLAHLHRGGLSEDAAFHALHVLDGFVYGYAWQDAQFSGDPSETPTAGELEGMLAALPHLRAHADKHLGEVPPGDGFVIGLDLILDGLERGISSRRTRHR